MATFAYYNISTASATTISAIDAVSSTTITNDIKGPPRYVTLCNKDASGDNCTVDLYIDNSDSSKTYYILHDLVIPGGATLLLESPELNYDSTIYALKFQLTSVAATQLVDIKVEY